MEHQHLQLLSSSKTIKPKKSEDFIEKQLKIIEELMERVYRLEETVSAMEGELAVVRKVNTLISPQLDEAGTTDLFCN